MRKGVARKRGRVFAAVAGVFLLFFFGVLFYYDYRSVGILSFFLPIGLVLYPKVRASNVLRAASLLVAVVCFVYLITEITEILEVATGIVGLAIIYALTISPSIGFILGFALGVLAVVPVSLRKNRRTE